MSFNQKEYIRGYQQRPSYKAYQSRFQREYRKKHPEKIRRNRLKMSYGLSLESYHAMLMAQDNKCAICLSTFKKTPHVDHCHETKKVRGLLCSNCNTGIGYFKENILILRSAEDYLERWGK